MTKDNTKLYMAFEEEAKEVNIEELMSQMLESYNDEKGYKPTVADEYRIRKMILARKYEEKEMDRLVMLKSAIIADWDEKIKKKKDSINGINDFIEDWVKKNNKGQKLSLDVATAALKRTGPKTKVVDEQKARAFLEEHKQLEQFLKPAPLDLTLLQNAYNQDFAARVEAATKEAIAKEMEEKELDKLTKKREAEIKLELEESMADGYFTQLPDFLEYQPTSKKITITMK